MSDAGFFLTDGDWAKELTDAYDEYMYSLRTYWLEEEELPEGMELPETLSNEPYCGCDVCETREQLFFLVPRIIKAYKEGKIVLTEDEVNEDL